MGFSTNTAGGIGKKMNLDLCFTLYTKINSKADHKLTKCKTLKNKRIFFRN